jgi:hypothetical protein
MVDKTFGTSLAVPGSAARAAAVLREVNNESVIGPRGISGLVY